MTGDVDCFRKNPPKFAVLDIEAMSYNYDPHEFVAMVFDEISFILIRYLVTHEGDWFIDKHLLMCRAFHHTLAKCRCCYARQAMSHTSCQVCCEAWRLSCVSPRLYYQVLLNGISQRRWLDPWTKYATSYDTDDEEDEEPIPKRL